MDGYARAILALSALVFAGTGLAFLLFPASLTAVVGIDLAATDARNDVRAVYGGLEIGLGVFLGACARAPGRVATGLLAVVVALGGMLGARLVSLLADGLPSGRIGLLALAELAGLALGAHALARERRRAGGI